MSVSDCTAAPVTLQGSVQQYDTRQPLAGVRVGTVGGTTVTTDSNGGFSYPVPQGRNSVSLVLTQPGDGVPAFLRTLLQIDDVAASRPALTLPGVLHDWRVSVAKACGVLATDASDDDVLLYFNQRSTLLVETGAAGIVSSQITVTVTQGADSWSNTDNSSSDTAPGARVCFLEKDADGNIVGGTASATTELGDFVMFRVRNEAGGGGGDATVTVSGHGSASISFDGAGQTGVVRLGSGW
ncbi:MAG TPA: hypothetical protein VG963_06445 [Polyangiaceae bacterium]|nr:hypothetical protein [Polyangiaceae bacterium]